MTIFTPVSRIDAIISQIKEDLLLTISDLLKKDEITIDEAQEIAKAFLGMLPVTKEHELYQKFYELTKTSRAARTTYLKYATPFDEEKRHILPKRLEQYVHCGRIDHALNLIPKKIDNNQN